MAVPFDQELRQQRFIQAYPQWSIHAQDEGRHFTAEKADGPTRHIVARTSLNTLLDRLDEIEASQ